MAELQVYGFWRSQATYRIRVALNLKGIPYKETPLDLDAGEQHSSDFLKINPLGSVPALLVDDPMNPENGQEALTQSLAILEYLEETHPDPPLLPRDPLARARVRSLASIAISDCHPLIVPRIRKYLHSEAGFDARQWTDWQTHWFTTALQGFEARLKQDPRTGTFSHGEEVSFADICLAGLVQGCRAFGIEVQGIETVERIVRKCEEMEAFERAKGVNQGDYPGAKA